MKEFQFEARESTSDEREDNDELKNASDSETNELEFRSDNESRLHIQNNMHYDVNHDILLQGDNLKIQKDAYGVGDNQELDQRVSKYEYNQKMGEDQEEFLPTVNSVPNIINKDQSLCRNPSTKEVDPTGTVFHRGTVFNGIYLPSLSGQLQDPKLEEAYQKYSYRQRQKSLVLVNISDLLLKLIVLSKLFCIVKLPDSNECYYCVLHDSWGIIIFLTFSMILNLLFALVSWWRCYANNYLHWGALSTWLLLLLQVIHT